jgi:hypothetical protein
MDFDRHGIYCVTYELRVLCHEILCRSEKYGSFVDVMWKLVMVNA